MGIIQTIVSNPILLLIVIVLIVVLAITGALFIILVPNIVAAIILAAVGIWMMIRAPIPDWRIKFGIAITFIIVAVMIYLYGNTILEAVV